MTEKPIDVVRRIHEAWARGEKASASATSTTVEGGKAVRFEWFNRPEEALAALGLQAPSDSASSG